MVNMIIGALLFAAMTYLGVGIDLYYRERLRLAEDYAVFIAHARLELKFLKTDLETLLNSYKGGKTKEFKKLLDKCAALLGTGEEATVESAYLSEPQKKAFAAFINSLAKADYTDLALLIGHAEEESAELLKGARAGKTNKGELYRKLLILAGVGIMIMVL